jgi:hypothetical protein
MAKVAFKAGLLVLMSIALGAGNASLAQNNCSACLTKETNDFIRRVGSSPPPAAQVGSHPAPVQASGASYCPGEAHRTCSLTKQC